MLNKSENNERSETTIKIEDLLYPFAVVLIMLSFSSLTGNLTILTLIITPIMEMLRASDSLMTIADIGINLIAQAGTILIFLVLYRKGRVEAEEKSMPSGQWFIVILVYSLLIAFTFFMSTFILILEEWGFTFESPYEAFEPTLELLGIPIYYLMFFGMYAVGAAVSEELVMRRTFIPFLERRGLGTVWTLLFSSLLFSLIHVPADILSGSVGFTIIHFFSTFAAGLALGFLYMRTRNIIWPIILHGLNNGVVALAQIGLVRWDELGDFTIFSLYVLWMLSMVVIGVGTAVAIVIQFFRYRKSLYPPAWLRILTDFNIRSSRLLPISGIVLGFIFFEAGIPIIFDIFYDLFGELNQGFLTFYYLMKSVYYGILVTVLGVFIYKRTGPLQDPDWVSDLKFPEAPAYRYSYGYSPSTTMSQNLCSSCGRTVPPNTQFCVFCGKRIENICKSCGRTVTTNTQFCVYCGSKIETTKIPFSTDE